MLSTKRRTVEKGGVHIGADNLDYSLAFEVEGPAEARCDFCGGRYAAELKVMTQCGLLLCPSCITSGPRAVAGKARKRRSLAEAAEVFSRLASFEQLPGGLVAAKVAEGYLEFETRARKEE